MAKTCHLKERNFFMKKWLATLAILVLMGVLAVSAQEDSNSETPVAIQDLATVEATATPVTINALLGLSVEPPMQITLPDGWKRVLLDTYIYHDLLSGGTGTLATVPIAVYSGPVSNNAKGWIVVLWAYDSIVPMDTSAEDFADRALWLDALRLLQFVVFDVRCNIGTAPQRDYTIGKYSAIGTTFTAVDCPFDAPDTRGWFATLDVDGLNFVFYSYIDPIPPAGSQEEYDLQSILDTVTFSVDKMLVTRDEFEATRTAYLSQTLQGTPDYNIEVTVEATAEATAAAGQ